METKISASDYVQQIRAKQTDAEQKLGRSLNYVELKKLWQVSDGIFGLWDYNDKADWYTATREVFALFNAKFETQASRSNIVRKTSWWACVAATFTIIVGMIWYCTSFYYDVNNDVSGNLARTGIADNPAQMSRYLHRTQAGMRQHGIDHGYAALWAKNANNNLGKDYQTFGRLADKLDKLSTQSQDTAVYQITFDNIRTNVLNIGEDAWTITFVKYWYTILYAIALIVLCLWLYFPLVDNEKDYLDYEKRECDRLGRPFMSEIFAETT